MSSYPFQIGFYCGCFIPVPLLFIREGSAGGTDNLSFYKPEESHLDLMERACVPRGAWTLSQMQELVGILNCSVGEGLSVFCVCEEVNRSLVSRRSG